MLIIIYSLPFVIFHMVCPLVFFSADTRPGSREASRPKQRPTSVLVLE